MKTERYKAFVCLTSEIPNEQGGFSVPVLETGETTDKAALLNYIKKLTDNKVIQAFRVAYSVGESWYFDNEVTYLREEQTIIGIE